MSPSRIVYSSSSVPELHLRRAFLESYGIECRIIGEEVLSTRPHIQGFADLVILDLNKLNEAKELIKNFTNNKVDTSVPHWICKGCKEEIEPQFTDCWKCGQPKS